MSCSWNISSSIKLHFYFSIFWMRDSWRVVAEDAMPELLILLFGSFFSKLLKFTVFLTLAFFFLLFCLLFFFHCICTLPRNWQIPALVLRCSLHGHKHYSTLSTPTLISSINQPKTFWHPEELSGRKSSSSGLCSQTSPTAALTFIQMAAGSTLHTSCGAQRAVWWNVEELLNVSVTEHM